MRNSAASCRTRRFRFQSGRSILSPKQFRLLDLFFFTAIIALHLAAFRAQAWKPAADWPTTIYLTPTAITCLLHIRLHLRIVPAVAVHFVTTMIWNFLHYFGHNAAFNVHFASNSVAKRPSDLAVYSALWGATVDLLLWAPLLAFSYGMICYSAIRASQYTSPVPRNADVTTGG